MFMVKICRDEHTRKLLIQQVKLANVKNTDHVLTGKEETLN